jgi:hypothetical protein
MCENQSAESIRLPAVISLQGFCMTDGLRENLSKVFMLPKTAIEWLVMVYDAIQVFDDVADGDPVNRKDLNTTIWNTLVGMHQNAFFIANSDHLIPLLATMILKWQASDTAERNKEADAKSFVWRAGYYDLVLMTIAIVHGAGFATVHGHHVMALYGEKYEDYMKEFGDA